jgi:hypothetical protein
MKDLRIRARMIEDDDAHFAVMGERGIAWVPTLFPGGSHAAPEFATAMGFADKTLESSGLKADAVTDAASSKIMPKGAVSAGFGGTAPRLPANPALWLGRSRLGPAGRGGSCPVAPPGITRPAPTPRADRARRGRADYGTGCPGPNRCSSARRPGTMMPSRTWAVTLSSSASSQSNREDHST